MGRLIIWLRLFRAQTAPATVYCLLIPYLIAGGRDLPLILYLFFVGHLLHYASFGHNSVMDYWHDVSDPSKKHHPLIAGEISLEVAHKVVHTMLIVACALLLIPIYVYNAFHSLLFLLLYTVFGHAYNDGLDHITAHSWLPITLCFTSLCASSYLLVGTFDLVLVVLALWAFLTMLYQIAWEGNLKDLWNPRELYNPLKKVTYIYSDKLVVVKKSTSFLFFCIRSFMNTALLIALLLTSPTVLSAVLLLVFTIIELNSLYRIHFKLPISRNNLLAEFGKAEAFEFFRLIAVLDVLALPLIAYGLLYFVFMNKLLWKTTFAPRV